MIKGLNSHSTAVGAIILFGWFDTESKEVSEAKKKYSKYRGTFYSDEAGCMPEMVKAAEIIGKGKYWKEIASLWWGYIKRTKGERAANADEDVKKYKRKENECD